MTTSLRSVSGGGYGFGVRPMRGALISGRKKLYTVNALHNPAVPYGGFYRDPSNVTLVTIGADGNQSGTAAASSLIDGASQKFLDTFFLFTESDNYCWAMVSNAANEFRLVRATYAGAITTPGAKFSPITPINFSGRIFAYESGGNIVVRAIYSGALYEHVISKATGQIVTQNTVIETGVSLDSSVYVTADGLIKFGYFHSVLVDDVNAVGLEVNGTVLPNNLRLSALDVFGRNFDAVGYLTPVLSGRFISFISNINTSVVAPLPLIERTEFDRWLKDVVNKFKLVS